MEIDLSNDSSVDGFNRDSIEKKMPEENEIEETINEAEKVLDLIIGMSFNSMKEAHLYYIRYARQNGFAVAIRTSKKGSDGKLKNVTIMCSRGGKPRIKSSCPTRLRPQSKTNCKACINISLRSDGRWILNQFVLDHNHSMSPGKSKFYKCNRVLQEHVKRRLELNDKAGIRLNKTYNTFAIEAGGHDKLAFLEKDCRNYLDKYRRLQLGEGDAIAMRKYFDKMHADNSNFYYTMDVDEKCRLRNVFWADARSRAAWKEFGDVVTFDTTYLVNKYDMPFAPFVGVNHHGQSILLGCGLISHEDTRSFVWLFESWMTCMSGYAPNAIITDQDQAMKKAIEIVFPHARHRWCLWHILKKVPEKLRGYRAYEDIKTCIHNAVYDSLTPEEFEETWGVMIEKYQLASNEWLVGLYAERYRWVPAFVKDTFWAGMSTTQRSESMHAYFDGYINSKTTLKQFVEQYGNALAKKAENESNADFNSFHSYIPCIMDYEFEKQFQKAYTISKFKEFQAEFTGKLRCYLGQCTKDHEFCKYEISEDVFCGDKPTGQFRRKVFIVYFGEETRETICNCRLFEFRGILCRHQITVYMERGIFRIPEQYIIRRWSKTVQRSHTKVRINYDNSSLKPEALRYDKMCNIFSEVATLAQDSEARCEKTIAWVLKLKEELKKDEVVCGTKQVFGTPNDSSSHGDRHEILKERTNILDPLIVRRKGRPPYKRKQSSSEKAVLKKKNMKKNTNTNEVQEVKNAYGTTSTMKFVGIGTQESIASNESEMQNIGGQGYQGTLMCPQVEQQNMVQNMMGADIDITELILSPLSLRTKHPTFTEMMIAKDDIIEERIEGGGI